MYVFIYMISVCLLKYLHIYLVAGREGGRERGTERDKERERG